MVRCRDSPGEMMTERLSEIPVHCGYRVGELKEKSRNYVAYLWHFTFSLGGQRGRDTKNPAIQNVLREFMAGSTRLSRRDSFGGTRDLLRDRRDMARSTK